MQYYEQLQSENGMRDVLYFSRFTPTAISDSLPPYDYHVAPEITHFIGTCGIMEIDGIEYEIKPGDLFLLRSNEKHRFRKIEACGIVENIRFDPAFIWQGNDSFDLNYLSIFDPSRAGFDNRLDRENPSQSSIRSLLGEIFDEFSAKRYGYAHMVKMRLFMILLTLIRDYGFSQDGTSALRPSNADGIRATMRYIDEHLSEPLTLPELSALAGLSPNYYSTLFKQINGISPVAYITSKRILHAIELLPNFRGTMLDLALACGFNNTANFNRAFRAYTGQTPSKYTPSIK